jgi:lysozyme
MIAAINDCYYEQAAVEMLDSRWANQVGGRSEELAIQMNLGTW